ncbi:putative SWA2 protein [Lyophyllum shimeji]|uniref:SWA2 protein n=1 Tax=Lyophyllum shimeji TaxID=47721 RepID=A0A9P3PED6_LYOSH|nr:putative SWA2 protein [Lyophyllum shimeji]
MSDSFADLWNSSAPSKPAPQPQKLGSALSSTTAQPKRPQQDVFSLLSSAGSSNSSSRSITPAVGGTSAQRTTPNPATKPSSNGGDAFSGLLGGSLAAGANGGGRMTMAERAAEAERQKLENLRKQYQPAKAPTSSAWDGLDSLMKPSTQSSVPSSTTVAAVEDDWGLDSFVSKPTSKAAPAKPTHGALVDDDDWLGEFSAQPNSRPKSPTRAAASQAEPYMLEHDDSRPPLPPRRRADSPGDFNFGNREDALLGDDSNDEDDILGVLSKPVDAIPKRQSPPTTNPHSGRTTPSPAPPQRPTARTNGTPASRPISPPPHILGQIVEMGFSVQQARVALASTETGLDVQAALDTLLANGVGAEPIRSPSPSPLSPDYQAPPRSGSRLMERERDRQPTAPSPSNSQLDRDRNIQEQADKLLAQASEIGLSVFNKASVFWKEGKERVQKAYVERTSAGAGSSAPGGAVRPKWMTEAIRRDGEGDGEREREDPWKDGLREPAGAVAANRGAKGRPMQYQPQQQKVPEPKPKPKVADLFSDDSEAVAYVSPWRRGKPSAAAVAASSSTSTAGGRGTPPPQRAPAPAPARAPSPVRQRPNLVSASPAAIATANKHKEMGSAKFKLGQYAEAEAAYTLGLGALPARHLLLVPLHNNRAIARLKTGDYAGAIADAGAVIELVGAGYHPAREAKVERVEEGAGVELGDALVKALKRRAEAWEGREKWEEAGRDWEMLAGLEWAVVKVREEAARGAGRCRRMVAQGRRGEGDGAAVPKPAVKPKPKPKPPVKPASLSRPAAPSQALAELRAATNAAEAEDQERHELKDSVDAKLMAWKGGKETNIRALLGSLDTVLWPELGLQKVGMAELVMPAQVKVKYTRTIAKLHPDKLNAGNTTVEQRMLANGVFGALNEAWNAFKQ